MSASAKMKSRYEIREPLGEGGMGVVYRAYDTSAGREVAIKTIRDLQNQTALDLFRKECDVQKSLNHPNIVDIYDIGEFEREGARCPYFVMPLLRGATLDKLIRNSSHRLTVERSVEIICQICKGLQAAHDHGLVHRDLKPSNIFVLEDDSVKIIDFGVAHLVEHRTSMGVKGTLLYMSPEQIQMKKPSALSDLFSLGVVCYETLTRRHPFERPTRDEVVHAILSFIPPPASELNPAVTPELSQVVHAAMAKQPWHRFSSARELADALQKAVRGELIERFDPARMQPRIERAQKAMEDEEYEFAAEILNELEAEGYIHPEIGPLKRQIDQAIRGKRIRHLLDSGRRRFKEEEYQLALQKVQEVLDLDPQNTEALTLKASIESRRSAQQIEGWFRLTRQHIENNAYNHARQALQNVLQLRPKDSQALQLLAEVDEKEQQYVRVRQEKERLYQAALDAWHKGEVSSALTKLERVLELDRDVHDSVSPERGATYQNLYNQVRSDYEAIKNSYLEARKHLESQRFTEALTICNEYLEKYPGHALFQALKFDVEERQRQELSAYIAYIDREVEKEPDLDRRVSILKEALDKHPNEHFQRALQLIGAKRDLVNSIVGKARNLEERGQFAEALAQWEILRNIYSQYPGLDFETERLGKRREQQARSEAKARWAEQVDRCVNLGDFGRARELARAALAEFPEDSDLTALERLAVQGMERNAEAQRLLDEAQALRAQQRPAEALETLRRAYQLDERNALIRPVLVEALLAQARKDLESDWRAAEALSDQAADLDPVHPLGKSLRLMIQDRKRAEVVDQCLMQAREAQAAGDLEGALSHVERGLSSDPQEPRLLQLQSTLRKGLQEVQKTQARRRDMEEMRDLHRHVQTAGETNDLNSIFERTRTLAALHPDDPEFQALFDEIDRKTSFRRTAEPAPGPVPQNLAPGAPPSEPAPAAPAGPSAIERLRAAAASFHRIPPRYLGIGAGVLLLLVAGLFWLFHRGAPAPPAWFTVPVQVTPQGARVRVDGKDSDASQGLRLRAGMHRIEVAKEGYEPAIRQIQVPVSSPIVFALEPFSQSVRIFSDLGSGRVLLDGQEPAELQDGQFTADSLKSGRHTVKVSGGSYGETEFAFEIRPGALPQIDPPQAKDLRVILVGSYHGEVHVRTTFGPVAAALDGRKVGDAGPDGLLIPNVTPGTHQLVLGEGRDARKIDLDILSAPTVMAQLVSDRNVGNIEIVSNEPDFQVLVDGKPHRFNKRRGRSLLSNLEGGNHTVRIAKDGFRSEPEQQAVEVRKGETARLSFTLAAILTTATLQAHLPPGATVFIDGEAQEAGPGGAFQGSVNEGEHTIELRRQGYRAKTIHKQFAAGQTVELTAAEMAMEKLVTSGTFVVTLSPAGARLTYRQESGGEITAPGPRFDVPPGRYTLKASAPNYQDASEDVEIAAGESRHVTFRLNPAAVPITRAANPMEGWDGPQSWRSDDGWFKRRGGGIILYKGAGVFQFSVHRGDHRIFGGHRVQWIANHVDAKNYDLFQLDKEKFSWRHIKDGRPGEEQKLEHAGRFQNDTYQLHIDISAGKLRQQIWDGKGWKPLGDILPAVAGGRFGFLIQANEELWLTNFDFVPQK